MKLINGDCIEEMKKLPENSVDAIVTDPPYDLVSINKRVSAENSAPAQFGKDGSFARLSKGFMGKTWDGTGIAFKSEIWKEALRILKPGGYLLAFGGTRTYHKMVCAIENAGFEIRDMIEWIYGSGFPKSLNIGKAVDKMQGNKREEYNPGGRYKYSFQEGNSQFVSETATKSGKRMSILLSKGNSEWEGWGTALKPAHEPIVVARKPLSEKTVAENVLKWGTGGINIDECRIGNEEREYSINGAIKNGNFGNGTNQPANERQHTTANGRFPANLIHDGSPEVLLGFPDVEEEDLDQSEVQQTLLGDKIEKKIINSSRFFYCAKAGKEERDYGCENLSTKPSELNSGGIGRECSVDKRLNTQGVNAPLMKNNHPTVKPVALMEYLVKLVTKPNGIVLDCFMGSGTTGIAAVKLGFDFIGIEKEKEYFEIANSRIKAYTKQTRLETNE